MKIRFNKSVELEVVESYDEENDSGICVNEIFSEDEVVDVDVFGENEDTNTWDIQFGDGSCVFGLDTRLIGVIEE